MSKLIDGPIRRVLVAKRGEIAVRIIRTLRRLGIESVLAVSAADRTSMAARMADRTVCIGPARATDSYLRIGTLVEAARGVGAQAVHPGYGFLSERSEFAAACAANEIIFIGPTATSKALPSTCRCTTPVLPSDFSFTSVLACVAAGTPRRSRGAS